MHYVMTESSLSTILVHLYRSFENNWNTYKLLAHINPPDVKVREVSLASVSWSPAPTSCCV